MKSPCIRTRIFLLGLRPRSSKELARSDTFPKVHLKRDFGELLTVFYSLWRALTWWKTTAVLLNGCSAAPWCMEYAVISGTKTDAIVELLQTNSDIYSHESFPSRYALSERCLTLRILYNTVTEASLRSSTFIVTVMKLARETQNPFRVLILRKLSPYPFCGTNFSLSIESRNIYNWMADDRIQQTSRTCWRS